MDANQRQRPRLLIAAVLCLCIAGVGLEWYYRAEILPLKRDFDPRYTDWTVWMVCVVRPVLRVVVVLGVLSAIHRGTVLNVPKPLLVLSVLTLILTALVCAICMAAVLGGNFSGFVPIVWSLLEKYPDLFFFPGVSAYLLSKARKGMRT